MKTTHHIRSSPFNPKVISRYKTVYFTMINPIYTHTKQRAMPTSSRGKLQLFSRMFAESLISLSQFITKSFIIVSLSVFSLRLFLRLASFLVTRPWRRYRTFTIRHRRRWRKITVEPYCSICLQDASEGEKMRRLAACGHCFHAECIDPWLEERSTCPECRAQIPPVPPEYPLIALVVPPGVIELFTK